MNPELDTGVFVDRERGNTSDKSGRKIGYIYDLLTTPDMSTGTEARVPLEPLVRPKVICTRCRHHERSIWDWCTRDAQKVTGYSKIDGTPFMTYPVKCIDERSSRGVCGPTGTCFEPSWKERIKRRLFSA